MKRRKYLPFYREEDATNSAPRVFAAADTTPDVCKKSSGAAWNTSEGCLKEGCECADSSRSAPTSTTCVSSSCTVDCDSCESPRTEKDENCLATLGMLCFWRLMPRLCVGLRKSLSSKVRVQEVVQEVVQKSTEDCPKRARLIRRAVHLACCVFYLY